MELYARHTPVRACVKGCRAHSLGVFLWRRDISFRFGQFVSLLTEPIFSFNFWETAFVKLFCHNQSDCALTLTSVMCMLCLCCRKVQNKLVDFCPGIVYDTATSPILIPYTIRDSQNAAYETVSTPWGTLGSGPRHANHTK